MTPAQRLAVELAVQARRSPTLRTCLPPALRKALWDTEQSDQQVRAEIERRSVPAGHASTPTPPDPL